MNKLKKIRKSCLFLGIGIFSIIVISSCTRDFEYINTDHNTIAEVGRGELNFLFTGAVESVPVGDQTAENLFSQQYAQYIANNATYFPTDRYNINFGWARTAFNPIYISVLPQLQTIFEQADPNSAEYAVANIWWVFAFHRVTDYWGPIPYSKAGQSEQFVNYDAQEGIYNDFFVRLTNAVQTLKSRTSDIVFGGTADVVYHGDVNKWIKFGNSLRLRLAMRISRKDPAKAKTEAEAAVASGVFTSSPGDDALMDRNEIQINKLSQMSEWFEFNMSATMESVLKGYIDPRISEYFLPAQNSGTYEGLRNGLSIAELAITQNTALANSHIGPRWSSPQRGGPSSYFSTPQNLMCAAEAYFCRAEGALLGWDMGGSAKELYESGIENSLKQWGFTDPAVIQTYTNGTTLPLAPNDFLSSPPASDVPVKFNTLDINIQKKQVAIQKWLAIFPDGCEGWAEYRRNHDLIPFYPVAHSDNTAIPDPMTNWIRRIPFLTYEYESNSEGVATGVQELSGPDNIATPLWWDIH